MPSSRIKMIGYFIISVILLICLAFAVLSITGRKQPALGLVNGQLRPCPATPNCVCSEFDQPGAKISPLRHQLDRQQAMANIQQLLLADGAVILTTSENYVHASYTSRVFRFIDDVEIRGEKGMLHIRSASRAGHSDFGVNRQRVERLRKAWHGMPQKDHIE